MRQRDASSLAPLISLMLGNEEDFTASRGFAIVGVDQTLSALDAISFRRMIESVGREYTNLKVVATTLRNAKTATVNDCRAISWSGGAFSGHRSTQGWKSSIASAMATLAEV